MNKIILKGLQVEHYHKNPRVITDKQFQQLSLSLDQLGDLGGIVHNLATDEIIGGNQRSKVFDLLKDSDSIIISETFDPPTEAGTVAVGYIKWNGERFSYRQVDWDDKTCERANIQANKLGGDWDWDILLGDWLKTDLLKFGFEFEDFENEDEDEEDYTYTRKVETPIYEPKNECPPIAALYDDTKTKALIDEINASEDLAEKEKEFLRIAAQRHTVFNFREIADFYSHAPAHTQDLMENSALVIIDFEKAIELGFVTLTKQIAEMVGADYGT